jgi:hypothetical protein
VGAAGGGGRDDGARRWTRPAGRGGGRNGGARPAVGVPGGWKRSKCERRERDKRARRAVKSLSLSSARDLALGKDFFKI